MGTQHDYDSNSALLIMSQELSLLSYLATDGRLKNFVKYE